jgi:hypothetical protein
MSIWIHEEIAQLEVRLPEGVERRRRVIAGLGGKIRGELDIFFQEPDHTVEKFDE